MCRNIKTLFNFEPPVTDEQGQVSGEVFRRVVYLPGGNAKHPEITPPGFAGATNEVRL